LKEITLTIKIDDCEDHHCKGVTLNNPFVILSDRGEREKQMPFKIAATDIQNAQIAIPTGAFDKLGNPLPLAGAVTFKSSDDTNAPVDASSGLVQLKAVGTFTVTRTDGVASDDWEFDVTAAPEARFATQQASDVMLTDRTA